MRYWLMKSEPDCFSIKTLIVIVLFLILHPVAAYSTQVWQTTGLQLLDKHKTFFVSGNPKNGSYLKVNGVTQFNSEKIYVTPKYRNDRLAKVNKSTFKKLEKYQKTIEQYKSQNKNIQKILVKQTEAEASLYKPRSFDSGENFKILLLSTGDTENPNNRFLRHRILDYKRKLVCEPLQSIKINLNDEDRTYLKRYIQ